MPRLGQELQDDLIIKSMFGHSRNENNMYASSFHVSSLERMHIPLGPYFDYWLNLYIVFNWRFWFLNCTWVSLHLILKVQKALKIGRKNTKTSTFFHYVSFFTKAWPMLKYEEIWPFFHYWGSPKCLKIFEKH